MIMGTFISHFYPSKSPFTSVIYYTTRRFGVKASDGPVTRWGRKAVDVSRNMEGGQKMRKVLFLAACLLFVACSAHADSVTYTGAMSTTPAGDLNTSVGMLSVSLFNPALGTLDSVSLTFTNQFMYSVSGQNNDGPNRSFSYYLGGMAGPMETVVKNASGTSLLDDVFAGYHHQWTGLNHGDSFASGVLTSTPTQMLYTPGNLSSFTGAGSMSFSVFSEAWTMASFTGGNMFYSTSTFTDPTVKVTYNYAPVPIPGAVWLLGSGLLGLIGLKRKYFG